MEIEENHKFKTPLLQVVLAASCITILGYLINTVKISDIFDFFRLLSEGLPLLKNQIFTSNFYANLPVSPIIIVWFIIGTVAYLNYYSLNTVYCNVFNYFVLKYNFTKPKTDERQFEMQRYLRLIVHSLIILSYTALYVVLFTALLPLGEFVRNIVLKGIVLFDSSVFNLAFSYLSLFLYWIICFGLLGIITQKIKEQLATEKLEEEHFSQAL